MQIQYFEELFSSNQYLLDLLRNGECEEGLCIHADFQTHGRGQQGNFWESKKGDNLTFSLLLEPDFLAPIEQFVLSQLVSVSIKQVLDRYVDHITIKWPNDIYWKDLKIAGILIENSLMGNSILHSVVGIGLNVNQDLFESSAPNPVSLKNILNRSIDRDQLLHEILNTIFTHYIDLANGSEGFIRQFYKDSLYRNDGVFNFSDRNGFFRAQIDRVLPDGRICLLAEGENTHRYYYFKEVAFLE